MDIETALKLIDLGFTTEQIKNFETPAQPTQVESPVVEEPKVEPVVQSQEQAIDYAKLAKEVALYNQRNSVVLEEPKVEVATSPVVEEPKSAQDVILGFLG